MASDPKEKLEGPPSEAAVTMMSAAVVASPPVPAEPAARARWLGEVGELATALYRQAQNVTREARKLSECFSLPATIVEVTEKSGRGVIKVEPAIGSRGKYEELRTPWLKEKAGADLFALAKSLVGVRCHLGKYQEPIASRPGETASMCAWIEPDVAQPAAAPRPTNGTAAANGAQPARVPPDSPQTSAAAQPTPETTTGGLDLAALRNLRLKSWDDLVVAAAEHFGLDADAAWAVGMEECGAAGPRNQVGIAKTWNKIVTRYFPAVRLSPV